MDTIAVVETPLKDERTELSATHLCQTSRWWGGEQYVSIHLRFLSSIVFRYDAPVGWIVLGVLALLAAIVLGLASTAMYGNSREILCLVALIACGFFPLSLVIYFVGRRQVLVLGSTSEEITVRVTAANKKVLRDFAWQVEQQQIKLLQGPEADLERQGVIRER